MEEEKEVTVKYLVTEQKYDVKIGINKKVIDLKKK